MSLKVICDQSALADALNTVAAVVASRTPTPVLTCIKITGADGRLRARAVEGGVVCKGHRAVAVTRPHEARLERS